MDIFISWSGERSLRVATALRDWLPLVIQSVSPWFSPEDIDKGARWMAELSKKLEKLKMGIICVTPENMHAPWLLFEAGALSKVLDTSLVCPFLFALEPTDLQGPLAQFEATRATKDDVRKLLGTISKNSEAPLAESQIDRLFSVLWTDLDERLSAIESTVGDQTARPRPVPELMVEVLDRVRAIERQLAERGALEDFEKRRQKRFYYESRAERRLRIERLHGLEARMNVLEQRRAEIERLKAAAPAEEKERALQLAEIEHLEAESRMLYEQIARERDALANTLSDEESMPMKPPRVFVGKLSDK